MYEQFMYLFGSGYSIKSILEYFFKLLISSIDYFYGYFAGVYSVFYSYNIPSNLKFYGENYQINEYLSVFISILFFILFNYIIFRIGKYFKFRKLKITEKNKNYFLIYAKFVPVGYIISNFILGGNSKCNFKQVFLYGLLGVLLNFISLGIYFLLIYFFDIDFAESGRFNTLFIMDLIFNNILFLIFTILYFMRKKK